MLGNFALLDFDTPDLFIILVIALIMFGGKRLPELSRSLGESIKEIKKAASSADQLRQEVKDQANEVKSSLNGQTKTTKTDDA